MINPLTGKCINIKKDIPEGGENERPSIQKMHKNKGEERSNGLPTIHKINPPNPQGFRPGSTSTDNPKRGRISLE